MKIIALALSLVPAVALAQGSSDIDANFSEALATVRAGSARQRSNFVRSAPNRPLMRCLPLSTSPDPRTRECVYRCEDRSERRFRPDRLICPDYILVPRF